MYQQKHILLSLYLLKEQNDTRRFNDIYSLDKTRINLLLNFAFGVCAFFVMCINLNFGKILEAAENKSQTKTYPCIPYLYPSGRLQVGSM